MSNVALTTLLLPILAATASSAGLPPLLLMLPATLAGSCGFMLPVATPPNAIVFATGRIPMGTMMRAGFLVNLIGAVVIWLVLRSLGPW
jgi:sodium-dependent dicarboxylate transporter 2/3/5